MSKNRPSTPPQSPPPRDQATAAPRDLATLYRRYAPAVFRRSVAILGDEEEARDAVHDVFLILHKKIGSFRGDAQIMTWIYRIATNHCLNRLRSRKARHRLNEALVHSEQTRPAASDAAALERRRLLQQLLSRSSTRHVQIVFHRFHDDMTQAEIAEVLSISDRGVRKALQKFYSNVRGQLAAAEAALQEAS